MGRLEQRQQGDGRTQPGWVHQHSLWRLLGWAIELYPDFKGMELRGSNVFSPRGNTERNMDLSAARASELVTDGIPMAFAAAQPIGPSTWNSLL